MWRFLKKSKPHKSFEAKKQEDKNFVNSLVKLGFVPREAARSALRDLAHARMKHPHLRAVDIMFKKGLVTRERAEIAFEKIGIHYRFCPNCLQRYSLKSVREGRHISCTRCHNVFEVTDNVLDVDSETLRKASHLVIKPKNPPHEEHPPAE
jgi:hypothetical protein